MFHELPKETGDAKHASTTESVTFLVFQATEKGQPLSVPVQWPYLNACLPTGVGATLGARGVLGNRRGSSTALTAARPGT